MDDYGPAHHAIVAHLLETGAAPSLPVLAARLGIGVDDTASALRRLEDVHGIVLHPGTVVPWVIHPFSLSPTATWVASGERGWWAPCTWCAFGIATLVGGRCTIHVRLGGESEDIDIDVADGRSLETDLVVHFAIRPRDAWNNVHHHCAMVLPFRSDADIGDWCERHGLPRGRAVPIAQVAELARVWYGRHADRDWRKWTVREAGALFRSVGLVDGFWELDEGEGRF